MSGAMDRANARRQFQRLAVPATIASISVPLVGFIDTLAIGQLGDANLIAGVAIGSVIFNLLFVVFNFLRTSTLGLVAQATGAGNFSEELRTVLRSGAIALACALVLVASRGIVEDFGLRAMGAQGGVLDAAARYFEIRIWSGPFLLVNYVIFGWMMGKGMAPTALMLGLMHNLVNILASLYFVLGLGFGVAGVATATVLSEVFVTLVGITIIARSLGWPPSGVRLRDLSDPLEVRRIIAINRDILIRSLALFICSAIFTRYGAAYGAIVLAANAVLLQIFQITGGLLDGIASAAEQMSGHAVGARSRRLFDETVRLAMRWGGLLAILCSLFLTLTIDDIVRLLTSSPQVQETAAVYSGWAALGPLAAVVAYQMDGIFVGATWSRAMRNAMLISALLFLLLLIPLNIAFANHGLWLAFLGFLSARSAIFLWSMRRLARITFGQ